MKNTITVFEVGLKVMIGEDIHATIEEILIRHNKNVSYKCIWWNSRDRKSDWFDPHEITTKTLKTITIGFSNE